MNSLVFLSQLSLATYSSSNRPMVVYYFSFYFTSNNFRCWMQLPSCMVVFSHDFLHFFPATNFVTPPFRVLLLLLCMYFQGIACVSKM